MLRGLDIKDFKSIFTRLRKIAKSCIYKLHCIFTYLYRPSIIGYILITSLTN